MPCGCVNNKKLNIEDMKSMSVDNIVRLYRGGYRIEGVSGDSPYIENQSTENNIYSMNPGVSLIYTVGYQYLDSQHMTVDVLVRNTDPSALVLNFEVYNTNATPVLLKSQIACIQPYNNPQNANGCTKVRIENMAFSDPYTVRVHRCISSPNCSAQTCGKFQTVFDDICTGEVKTYTGIVPPLTSFPPAGAIICGSSSTPVNMAIDCASCTPSWVCIKDALNRNTGYKYDSCTQNTLYDTTLCPLPPIPQSTISIAAGIPSPFDKNSVVTFSGTLQYDHTIVSGADVTLVIDVGGAEVLRQHITTTSTAPNWSWNWTVPSTMAGVDTSGTTIIVTVETGTTPTYLGSSAAANYLIAGISCTSLGISASKTTANVGEKITITTFTRPLGTAIPVIINLDGARLGTCETLALGSISSMQQRTPSRIQTMPAGGTISILNPPTSVMAGQIINFQVEYHLTGLDFWGDIVRLRICTGSLEIGYTTLATLFGSANGTKSFDVTIPASTPIGTPMPLVAQVSLNQSLATCTDPDVITQSSPLDIQVVPSMNVLSIVNPPDAVIAGKTIDIVLNYAFFNPAPIFARFRTCDSIGNELGHNAVYTSNTGNGIVTISTTIPSGTIGSITIKGEVTTNDESQTCGDAGVIAISIPRTISVTTQALNTISLIDLPVAVRAGEAVDFKVSYNFDINYDESIRVRICSGTTEIGHIIEWFWWGGNKTGVYTINSLIPSNATGNVAIKAELTKVSEDATCGSQVFASSALVNIPVTTAKQGECQIVWDTTGSTGGDHFVTAEVLGHPACSSILRINLIAPPAPCTSISLGISDSSPVIGDVVDLVATVQPPTSSLNVTFKAGNTAIGTNCISTGGSCATKWKTTGLTPGVYRLTAAVEGQCASIPLDVTLSSTAVACTSITVPTAAPSTVTVGDTVTLRATAQPTTSIFTVSFKDQNSNLLGTANTVNGVATLQWNTTGNTAGTYNIKAHVGTQCISSAAIPVILSAVTTCTSITTPTATPSTVTIGSVVTLSATAQPTTTVHTVSFKDQNNNLIGSANTESGVATVQWSTTGKTAGAYNIKASVGTQCTSSAAVPVTLIAAVACTSITTPTATPSTVTIGGTVSLVATAQPTTSIFTISFKDQNNNVLGTVDTVNGVATLPWSTTGKTAGAYNIKASVGTQCTSSAAVPVTLSTQTTACISITVPTATPSTVTIGQVTTLSATAQPITATFTVDFKDQNNNIIGSANTSIGTGIASYVWNTSTVSAGTYNIKAYVGTQCVSTTAVAVTVNSTTVTCTSVTTPQALPSVVTVGQSLGLRATVQPTTSIFTVDFKDQNNITVCSANTVSGVATCNWNTAGKIAGTYNIYAHTGACVSSAAVPVTLNPSEVICTSITTPTTSLATVTIGGTTTLTTTVQPLTMVLNVAFKDQNNNVLGTANTVNGLATLQWSTAGKTAGAYNIKAYADSCISPAAVTVTLITAVACTSITVPTATPSTVTIGQVTTLSATAQPITATFTVDFKDQNNNIIGSANTSSGIASYIWNTGRVSTGTYNIKAYVGTLCVSSGPVVVTVSSTTTACTSVTTPLAMPSSAVVGELVALRATVQPTTSIFTVTFKDQNNNVIGYANTSSGIAAYNWDTTNKSAGAYQIKAYAGTCVSPVAVIVTLSGAPGAGGGGGIGMLVGLVGVAALSMMIVKSKPK